MNEDNVIGFTEATTNIISLILLIMFFYLANTNEKFEQNKLCALGESDYSYLSHLKNWEQDGECCKYVVIENELRPRCNSG